MTVSQLVKKRASEEMSAFLARSPQEGVEVTGRLGMGDPVKTICTVAMEGPHDLVVMGTHGRTGISRALAGSVTENVVRRCPVPVLTVRTPDEATRPREARVAKAT